jgi:molybdopterin molybdotransferase
LPTSVPFDLLAVVDFSAASARGGKTPCENQIWAVFETPHWRSEPTYFRTRFDLIDGLITLLRMHPGNALIAWDLAFGYPAGSGIGGGRKAARAYRQLIEDDHRNRNNRFEVAERLNRQIGDPPGPFWARPAGTGTEVLKETMEVPWRFPFDALRTVERLAHQDGFNSVQSVWKLFTPGSVGSQTLMGLATIERLNEQLQCGRSVRYWPFDTDWDRGLSGVVHVECWPGLFPFDHIDHPIRDARQVVATLDVISGANAVGNISKLLGRPSGLSAAELLAAEEEEGWIAGFRTGLSET